MEKSSALTKDAKFIQGWADTGFDPERKDACARAAGFSPTIANKRAGKIINSLIQNRKMQREMKKAGVDMKRLAGKISELLEARHPLAKPIGKDDEGNLVYPPDNFVQLKAAELGIRIHDAFAPTRMELDKSETKQIVMTAEVVHRLERFNSQRELMGTGETIDVEPIADQQG